MSRPQDTAAERVRIPADVDREDRLIANLTARQLAILAATGLLLWVGWAATRRLLPLPVFAGLAAPVAGAALTVAVGRWHGLPADRLLTAFARHQLAPRRLVPAPGGIPAPEPAASGGDGLRLGPLRLPVQAIAPDGTLHLADGSTAVLAHATAVSFALRTPAEREALTAGFGRYLNSLAGPVQVLLGAEPVDLQPIITELHTAAPSLPHPLLEAACRGHAAYLAAFAASRPLLRREVLLIIRTPPATTTSSGGGGGPSGFSGRRLRRRNTPIATTAAVGDPQHVLRLAADAAAALGGAGVTLTVLDGTAAAGRLSRSLDPHGPPRPDRQALPDAVITSSFVPGAAE
jgi:hypothetical protein